MTDRLIERDVELLALGERHMLVRCRLTDCVVSLPFAHIETVAAESASTVELHVVIPLWLAAEKGIA